MAQPNHPRATSNTNPPPTSNHKKTASEAARDHEAKVFQLFKHCGFPKINIHKQHGGSKYDEDGDGTFETIDLGGDLEKQRPKHRPRPKSLVAKGRRVVSSAAWWKAEYWYACVCVATLVLLCMVLKKYDNQVVPELGGGIQMDTLIIAMVSVIRITMKAIVGAALSQAAWVWLSEKQQQKCKHPAYLRDFSIFNGASNGIWASLCLLWRMKFRHRIGCIGAALVILSQGFETFSQQMVTFEQQPQAVFTTESSPAPPPPRSEIWDTYLAQGFTGGYVPALSTKAAVYSGIISNEIPMTLAPCETGNCTWPLVPTLAACGECNSVPVKFKCNETSRMCTYRTESGTSLEDTMDVYDHSSFLVSPTNGTLHKIDSPSRAYFSVFNMLSVNRPTGQPLQLSGQECALWFCLRTYKISVAAGKQTQDIIGDWSNTTLRHGNGFRGSEYIFTNIPKQLNVVNTTRYSVTHEAMLALRTFMAGVTSGTLKAEVGGLYYSSDWVEAMWNASDSSAEWIKNLAHSLTVEIRHHGKTNSGQSSVRYNGAAMRMEPVIKVQ
ncbi:Protein of unknown function (DUF3176) domain containing protein [Naviculisporaceae sp. PSN 640]